MCSSPRLIAACHDLLRLLMPRHSPCALLSLTSSERISYRSFPRKHKNSLTPSLLLSKSKPLRWVSIWYGAPRRFLPKPSTLPFRGDSLVLTRIMQAPNRFHCSIVLPILKVPQKTLLPLCCLLAISCLLHCSVFKVQLQPSSRSD